MTLKNLNNSYKYRRIYDSKKSESLVMADSIGLKEDYEANENDTLSIPIIIQNVSNGPIQTIKCDIQYNESVLFLESVEVGNLTNGWTILTGDNVHSVTLTTTDSSISIKNESSGNIFNLHFNVTGNAGDTTAIYPENIDMANTANLHGSVLSTNKTVDINNETTVPSEDDSSGNGGSGGGGGGATGEEFENIASKHAQVSKVAAGEDVRYEFSEDDIDLMTIQFTSLSNEGQSKTSVEVLKDTSALVDSSAPGKVYQNLNIWVGNVAFNEDDMEDPVVGFRVSKEWISDNDVEPSSVVLCRYNDGEWTQLPTEVIDENENYFIYESETPGFSPFAISAIYEEEETSADSTTTLNESLEDRLKEEVENRAENESTVASGFGILLTVGVLMIIALLIRR
ncbi:PGF-pre-PGF domain-containing protein [Methanohalophilus sp. RSK]|uniref:PGF-pre-PGF domain-containing protein n=1 Tax=Methanohalophilus sp. RSK TaxID=2485783 RepID=UPI000F439BBA|nr:PGF-pre-PGF domain-containing protein [Methanohalophilus sp. RSK]RNI12941.1 PGF-pre-PGF domain-containing protein [Methanohalophilus sp. RSK]